MFMNWKKERKKKDRIEDSEEEMEADGLSCKCLLISVKAKLPFKKSHPRDFSGGPVVKNLPANTRDIFFF